MNIANTKVNFSIKSNLIIIASCLAFSGTAFADEQFYGTIDSRPTDNVGIWVVSGQQVEVTDKTDIETDHGPLVVGMCGS